MKTILISGPLFLVALMAIPGFAAVSIDGYSFDDNAFPDSATYLSGGPPTLSFVSTGNIDSDLLMAADSDITSYIYGDPVLFQLDFLDNIIVNAAGADLVIFELGTEDAAGVSVKIGDTWTSYQWYLLTDTGYAGPGFEINAAAIDLDSFGVPSMGLIQSIRIDNNSLPHNGTTISSSICAVGALNSVPEPATMFLLATGGLALLVRNRRGQGTSI